MKKIGKFLLGLVLSLTIIGTANISAVEAKNTFNLGTLDVFLFQSNCKCIVVDGWHAINTGTFGSSQKMYHYLFVMDDATGKELTRVRLDTYDRDDVVAHCKNGYGANIYRSNGFYGRFYNLERFAPRTFYIKSRYTSDPYGDSAGHVCVDFDFAKRLAIINI